MFEAPPGPCVYSADVSHSTSSPRTAHLAEPSSMADIQEADLTPSPHFHKPGIGSSNSLSMILLLILDSRAAVNFRLDVYPHPLHPLDLHINSAPPTAWWSEGERIGLLILLAEEANRRFASWRVGHFARWARNCRFRRVNRRIVRRVGDLSLVPAGREQG